ncbi:hypothetical protein ACU4GI_32690 [Cupriavidus basilensis]
MVLFVLIAPALLALGVSLLHIMPDAGGSAADLSNGFALLLATVGMVCCAGLVAR